MWIYGGIFPSYIFLKVKFYFTKTNNYVILNKIMDNYLNYFRRIKIWKREI